MLNNNEKILNLNMPAIKTPNIALITGAASKLGKILCRHFLNQDWKVILHFNQNWYETEELIKNFKDKESCITVLKSNFNNLISLSNDFENICQDFGVPNLVINNAAYFQNDNFSNLSLDNLERHLNINFKAPILLTNSIVNILRTQKSLKEFNIINMLDYCISAHPKNEFISYALSKMAMSNATKLMALSLAPQLRVNGIAPGPFIKDSKQNEEKFIQSLIHNPLKVATKVEDVINTIEFLITTRCITGEIIHLDGGRNLMRTDYY
ncbi:SDR family oxidoreductase [Rickettsiales endosymbiont of Stachyamoeba lipophora]|uniref:SDR family oxidoreductase n=1 Tax=Rickettsiales endosymbiont of Stachyamoeba lipophora TaxID=2486578 RepID=UPI000F646A79|nr:SDR family oxidoreductase [Rickettsiales endosymbiont of Stachyamoeba lipophora]AZL15451.1 SDR family oxidoreductase [Rickettsiales endosymbiont of Stachyamoeba lipophora]